jgi:hypothetical protein
LTVRRNNKGVAASKARRVVAARCASPRELQAGPHPQA